MGAVKEGDVFEDADSRTKQQRNKRAMADTGCNAFLGLDMTTIRSTCWVGVEYAPRKEQGSVLTSNDGVEEGRVRIAVDKRLEQRQRCEGSVRMSEMTRAGGSTSCCVRSVQV